MSSDETAAPRAGSPWRRWIVYAIGVALLVFVLNSVHWRDTVVLAAGDGGAGTTVVGEIVGEIPSDWETGRLRFQPIGEGERELSLTRAQVRADQYGPEVNEGIIRIVRLSDKTMLAIGLVLFGLIAQIGVTRWWLLLRAQDIVISFGLAHRLTFIGFFFNNVVPGPTGGDVVKAAYAARKTGRTGQAIVTVVIDRVVGIIALALIAAFVLVTKLDDARYHDLAKFIGLFLGGVAATSIVFFSRRIRRLLRLEDLGSRLPGREGGLLRRAANFVRKADEAVFLWRGHKRAVAVALAFSFANQICIQGMMILFASALHITTRTGDPVHWTTYMAVLPVAFIVSALPMLPGGWGIRELAFVAAFGLVGVERNPALALSVLNGMTSLFWSLPGGVYFLLERSHAAPAPSHAEKDVTGS